MVQGRRVSALAEAAVQQEDVPKQPAGTDAAGVSENVETRSFLKWSSCYALLFAAHWCGAHRFSKMKHPEDDFDPENVQHYLKNRVGHKADRTFLHGNFRRVDHKALKRVEAKARAMKGPTGTADADVQGTVEEDVLYDNLLVRQIPPYFILSECLIVLAFWVVGAALYSGPGSEESMASRLGGLDTLDAALHQETDLRWSNPECQDLRFQAWRWVTYQFTHIGVQHVLMNMLLTVTFGIPLEGVHGPGRMFLLFNVGVLGGAMGFILFEGHGFVVGMSGGCYALIGIHFADLLINWDSRKFKYSSLNFLLFLVTVDVGVTLADPPENVSHAVHIGGAVTGLIFGVLLCKNLADQCYERVIEVVMAIVAVGLLVLVFVWLGTQDEGPRNLLQAAPGWCSAFAFMDTPPGEQHPKIMCSFCGTEDCLEALRHRYPPTAAVDEAWCAMNHALWVH